MARTSWTRLAWGLSVAAALAAGGLALPGADAGDAPDKKLSLPETLALEWQLPDPKAMLPFARQEPLVFVTTQQPAEWIKLTDFWNPATGLKVERPIVKLKVPLGLAQPPKVPAENAMTVARWKLGRDLYFDPVLSSDHTVACASCHAPAFGFTDQLPFSSGIHGLKGGMSAPTVMNAAYSPLQFWDGRAISLEDQAQGPVQNPVEMFSAKASGKAWHAAVQRVRKKGDYAKRFLEAYGCPPTQDAIAKAIATYERTVLNGNSIYDRADRAMRIRVAEEEGTKFVIEPQDFEKVLKEAFVKKDETALAALKLDPAKDAGKVGELARQLDLGRNLFFGKARCSLCHTGDNFSDGGFHNLGIGVTDGKLPPTGMGRYAAEPIGHKDPAMVGAFKTPTLRGLVSTAPYMHDGSDDTLEKVIDLYDRGGNANAYLSPKMRDLEAEKAYVLSKQTGTPYRGPEVKLFGAGQTVIVPFKLNLNTQEKAALVAFLRSLEGEVPALVTSPKLPVPTARK
jgi:cytochrome c peroxidase